MAILAWIRGRHFFLKIQEGTDDNLSNRDVAEDFAGYFLWSSFFPGELDIDESMEPELKDGGMLLYRNVLSSSPVLQGCCEQETGERFNADDVILLEEMKEA